jgi:DNA modification methylase
MQITHLKELTSDPRNARKHTPRNVGAIVSALHEVGAARSIVIDEDGVVLAGNATIEAAAEAGITRVQVVDADGETVVAVRRSGLTPEQKTRLALFDNRAAELADWDTEVLRGLADEGALVGMFEADELAALFGAEEPGGGLTDPDAVPDERATDIKVGDLFNLGKHLLLCGDSTKAEDVARVMNGSLADCVFTSPPYGVGIDYGTYQDSIENLRAMLPVLAERWRSVVRPGGFAVVNFGDIASGRDVAETKEPCEYPMALEYWPIFRSAGWVLWSRRVWCKPNPRVHSLQCIQSNRAATDWEHVWTWKAPGEALVRRVDGEHASANGWFDTTSEHGVDVGKETHGAGMAVALPVRMIAIHSQNNNNVHEPFCGTGTTLIACEQLGRVCHAIEISPVYCQVAIDRWEAFTGQKATKVGEAVR